MRDRKCHRTMIGRERARSNRLVVGGESARQSDRERGFEFYWEMVRRTDMIRFGKYEDAWTEKTDNDKLKRLFPIPQTAIDGASEIPGFLAQNQGY